MLFITACENAEPIKEEVIGDTTMTSVSHLKEMYDDLEVKTTWNLEGPLLYGYFFTDSDSLKLVDIKPKLEDMGYRFVEIFRADPPDEIIEYFLHVEKEEIHTPETLAKRNKELKRFAKEHQIQNYDGFDMGQIEAK